MCSDEGTHTDRSHLTTADPGILCHTYGRGRDQHIPVPGRPYSIACALEPGRSSWTAPLHALRLASGDDTATVTARQLRDLVKRLITAGQRQTGEPDVLVIADAGYDAPGLAFLLRDLPVQVLARALGPRPASTGTAAGASHRGRPPRHGGEFVFGHPDTWGTPDTETVTGTRLYGTALARSWDRLHPRLTLRSPGAAPDGTLPIIEETVIRLDIEHLPSGATPKPVWLWWSGTDAVASNTDRLWHAYLRRFDIDHTFSLFEQTLGWTCPKIRTLKADDRWTWLVLATYIQLRLPRPLAADRRRPGKRPVPADRLTPARVRRDFRHIRLTAACPARAPEPTRPGPGGPPGRKNTRHTRRYDVHTPRKIHPADAPSARCRSKRAGKKDVRNGATAKEAAVARFLRECPQIEQADYDHPAPLGCTGTAWSQIPGCPAGILVLLRELLDAVAGPEALRALGNVLMNDVFHVSAAMPPALPLLIRLAALPDIAVSSSLVDLLVVAAQLSQLPTRTTNARSCCSATTAITWNANGAGPPSPHTLLASALRALLEDETHPNGPPPFLSVPRTPTTDLPEPPSCSFTTLTIEASAV